VPPSAKNKSFTLYDDDHKLDDPVLDGDDAESVVPPKDLLALMQASDSPISNVFAPAYVRPVQSTGGAKYDGGGNSANDSMVSFQLNIMSGALPAITAPPVRASNGHEGDDFWVTYLLIAYQEDNGRDGDPDSESAVAWSHQLRQSERQRVERSDSASRRRRVSRALEGHARNPVVHATRRPSRNRPPVGLAGDTPGFGLMSGTSDAFDPRHLNVIRWRVRSPGTPY
jgi:hypothetical protein